MGASDSSMPSEPRQEPDRGGVIPTHVKLGYGIGAMGGQIFRDTPALILPIYMITVLGIPPWIAGIAILLPKAWIIFCDPLVGNWSDRRAGSWGRAPFLAIGAVLTGITFVLMFMAPSAASVSVSTAYMTLSFALASTAYSLFSVPYLSAAAEMSPIAIERTSLMAYRMVCLSVGVAIGSGYALPVVRSFGGGWTGFHRMSLLYGAICMASMLITYATVRRLKPRAEPTKSEQSIGSLSLLAANKPFVYLAIAYLIALVGQAITYTVFGLFFMYVMKAPDQLILVNIPAALAVIAVQPLGLWLARSLPKRTIYTIGIIGWALLSISWLDAGPDEPARLTQLLGIPLGQSFLLIARGFLWGGFNSLYVLMALSILTDTIAQTASPDKPSHSGLFSGVFSATEKVAFALGPAIAGIILSVGGFTEDRTGVAAQSASAIRILIPCFTVIPAALNLASLFFLARCRLKDAPAQHSAPSRVESIT